MGIGKKEEKRCGGKVCLARLKGEFAPGVTFA